MLDRDERPDRVILLLRRERRPLRRHEAPRDRDGSHDREHDPDERREPALLVDTSPELGERFGEPVTLRRDLKPDLLFAAALTRHGCPAGSSS